MNATLTIRDEEVGRGTVNEFSLDFLSERIDVEELIRSRVYQEVKDHNAQQNQETFQGLVQPTGAERTLNGYLLKKPRQIDWKKQFEHALEAFRANRIVVLINERQAESLGEQFDIKSDTAVTFLRLTPLVGG